MPYLMVSMLTSSVISSVSRNVFRHVTGSTSENDEKIFWYLYQYKYVKFSDIEKNLGMNPKLVNQSLTRMLDKNIVTKTTEGKYCLSPQFSKSLSPLLNFEYIHNKQPPIHTLFFDEKDRSSDMNLHSLYGFNKRDITIETMMAHLNNEFSVLRGLKAGRDEDGTFVSSDAFISCLCNIFTDILSYFLKGHTHISKTPELFKKLAIEADRIAKQINHPPINHPPFGMEELEVEVSKSIDEFIYGIPSKHISIINKKSDNVAVLITPSFINKKPLYVTPSSLDELEKMLPEGFHGSIKEIYGNCIKFYQLGTLPRYIWKIGLIIYHVIDSIKYKEIIDLMEYEVKKSLAESEFSKAGIDFIWGMAIKYRDDGLFIPALLEAVWYEGLSGDNAPLSEVRGADEFKRFLEKYGSEMEKMIRHPFRTGAVFDDIKGTFKHKDKAFEVMEYLIGKKIVLERAQLESEGKDTGKRLSVE